jgi:hypothetical protein
MARRSSLSVSGTPPELLATKGMLDQRWIELTSLMLAVLDLDDRQVRVDAEYEADGAWAGLGGIACEPATRERGLTSRVAPLCFLPANLVAWLGYQEVWEASSGPRQFRFRHIGLTVHVGMRSDPLKPQLLRLEWPGIRNWSGAGLSFQSPGAAHPHWQIDVLQSLSMPKAQIFGSELEDVVEDFEETVRAAEVDSLLRALSIERMHLACAAPWWLPTEEGYPNRHMNAPIDLPALSRWLRQSVLYLRQELNRCVIRPR